MHLIGVRPHQIDYLFLGSGGSLFVKFSKISACGLIVGSAHVRCALCIVCGCSWSVVSFLYHSEGKISNCNSHLAGLKDAKYDFIIPSLSETTTTD